MGKGVMARAGEPETGSSRRLAARRGPQIASCRHLTRVKAHLA